MNSPNGEEGGEYDPNNVLGGAQKRFADEYQTGGYIMLAPAIVTKNIERDSEALSTQLKPSQKINIVQIKQLEDRIRGQLKSGGWISIAHLSVENWVWAEMIDKPSENSMVGSTEEGKAAAIEIPKEPEASIDSFEVTLLKYIFHNIEENVEAADSTEEGKAIDHPPQEANKEIPEEFLGNCSRSNTALDTTTQAS